MTLCLQKKAMLIKGKKTAESNRALEARVAMLEVKTVWKVKVNQTSDLSLSDASSWPATETKLLH